MNTYSKWTEKAQRHYIQWSHGKVKIMEQRKQKISEDTSINGQFGFNIWVNIHATYIGLWLQQVKQRKDGCA